MNQSVDSLYAELYDEMAIGWPGETEFYRQAAAAAMSRGDRVLEVACGTGRITIPLARAGIRMTGMDQSPEMLAVARRKSHDTTDIRWAEADMRYFDLGERYGLVLVPAHSFQFMLTPADQVSCLEAIKRHLDPQGTVIIHLDHQDIDWLGNLPAARADDGERERVLRHPVTGRSFRRVLAWSYERSTQTAAVVVEWEELDQDGAVIARRTQDPMPLHCVFPFEMDHLLGRVGLKIEALYGDFFRRALHSGSSEMIWVARPHQR